MSSGTITLETVQADLALWLDAQSAAADGQSFTLNGRTLTGHNLEEIRNMIASLSRQERQLLRERDTGKKVSRFGGSVARFN